MCCGHYNKKQPHIQVTFRKLNILQIKETSENNNCSFKTSNGDIFQLLWQNSTQPTFVDSINKNVCCGHYKKSVADITYLGTHFKSFVFSSFCSLLVLLGICLYSWVSYVHYDFNNSTVFFCILLVGHTLYSSVSLIVLLW